MAHRKSMKIQPAITDLSYTIPAGGTFGNASYIDTARSLSRINRRLYEQGRMVAYQGLTFIWRQSNNGASPPVPIDISVIEIKVQTAGNTWVVQNSFVKGKALWDQMQDLVLDDNPSVKGKWHDFKLALEYTMTAGRMLNVKDGAGVDILAGEWDLATYVMPQHEVDPATGQPLAADEFTATLIGIDSTGTRSLVKAYEDSRAMVQEAPLTPGGMGTSFFSLLTDTGSQEPELADVIEEENNYPPYDISNYVGSGVNGVNPVTVGYAATSAAEVDGRIGPFVAPCGLLKIEVNGYDSVGNLVDTDDMPDIDIILHVAPGMYKGVAAIPMGQ